MLVVAGLGLAFTTALLYAVAITLQTLEAREAPDEHHLRLSLLLRLVRKPRILVSAILAFCGWAAQVGALLLIPLTLVAPALATSLIVLLAIGSRVLQERVGRREIGCVTAMTLGIALLAWAAPEREANHATGARLASAVAVLAAFALLPYVLARASRPPGAIVAVGAGAAYALDGLATKFFSDDFVAAAWLGLLVWGATMAVAALLGTLSEMSALQRRPATQVAPVVLGLTTLVPVALAPLLAGESWTGSPWLRTALAVSILLIIGGAVLLATSPAVGAVLEAEAVTAAPDGDPADSGLVTPAGVRRADGSGESSAAGTTTSPA